MTPTALATTAPTVTSRRHDSTNGSEGGGDEGRGGGSDGDGGIGGGGEGSGCSGGGYGGEGVKVPPDLRPRPTRAQVPPRSH